MHEYSIVQALLERVDQEVRVRGASAVHRVHVSIGEVSGVEIELLQTAFDTIQRGTVCEGARLDVRRVPARWECRRCGAPIAPGAALRCRTCEGPARLAGGDEIMLERIDMEAA
jgi:hydrogenase nickel incorporation protein HypA/HybF